MIGLKLLNPRNYRDMFTIVKISNNLEKHMMKRCAYCDMDMGLGDQVPVVDFVQHLKDKHPEKVMPEDIKHYEKLIARMTR